MATDSQIQATSAIQAAAQDQAARSRGSLRVFLILLASFLIMIIVAAVVFGFMIRSWEDTLREEIERSLTQKAQMFAGEVNNDHSRGIGTLAAQAGQSAGARATVIDMNGKVIADSEVRVADLDNQSRSPEFAAALHGDTGVDVRSRSAFGIPVLYVAVPVSGGAVRLAYPLADLGVATSHATRVLILFLGISILAAIAVSAVTAKLLSPRQVASAGQR